MTIQSATTKAEASDTLEQLVDAHGLDGVVTLLADICAEKAEHLRSGWGDRLAAKVWLRDARKLNTVAFKLEN